MRVQLRLIARAYSEMRFALRSRSADAAAVSKRSDSAYSATKKIDDAYAKNWALRMEVIEQERKASESWQTPTGRRGIEIFTKSLDTLVTRS